MYLGNRYQGEQRYLGTAEILSLQDINFHDAKIQQLCYLKRDDGTWFELKDEPLRELFIKDGFGSLYSFMNYHMQGLESGAGITKQIITFGNVMAKLTSPEIIEALEQGKSIRRKSIGELISFNTNTCDFLMFGSNEENSIKDLNHSYITYCLDEDPSEYSWDEARFTLEDLKADDWEIVNDV